VVGWDFKNRIITMSGKSITKKFEKQFEEINNLIKKARNNALRNVNNELIKLYWNVGNYISKKVETAEWGQSVVNNLADYLKKKQPDLQGFSRRGLYRMKQFYETYKDVEKVSPLLTQISWSNHLHILSKTKTMEEKEYYLRLAARNKYAKRDLERQIDSGLYERYMLSDAKVSPVVTQNHPDVSSTFRDTYVLEFLSLPEPFSEKDLQKAIVKNMKKFILELGSDFIFAGENYRIQVGNNDYFIDLLFFHRDLRCLVVFELKIDDFKPEYLGKLNFYLEALDRDVKKEHENPSVGVILCKSKNDEVVEYALSRNMSPALIAEYRTKLIDKKILLQKLHELYELSKANFEE
jgi:predicted nuclease of restriction endonuclease-like (RecB) superfamily